MPVRRQKLETVIRGLKSSVELIQKEIVDLEHELRALARGVATGVSALAVPRKRLRRRLAVRKASAARMKGYRAEQKRISGARKVEGNDPRQTAGRRSISRAARKAAAARTKAIWAARRTRSKTT